MTMKINSFSCIGLNGYLDFDIKLFRDISILIGINGSGKTSILRSIVALIGPDLDWLMTTSYKYIQIIVNNDDEIIRISAKRQEDRVCFSFRSGDRDISEEVADAQYQASVRVHEDFLHVDFGEVFRVRERQSDLAIKIAPLQAVRKLPTPIFLGLDRTTLPTSTARGTGRSVQAGLSRKSHPAFRTLLEEGVAQAEAIAVDATKKARVLRSRHASKLREDMLLTLFSKAVGRDEIASLQRKDISAYEKVRRQIKSALSSSGIESKTLSEAVDPFFDIVISLVERIVDADVMRNISKYTFPANRKEIELYSEWVAIAPRISLIKQMERIVERFNKVESEIFSETNRYLSILNSFFMDSHKTLLFAEDGSLNVKLPSGALADVYRLSSGERQIFILITNLLFSDEGRRPGILIVDEPELSLHLRWQEMFIDALQKANPSVQLILATHSPSIISDRIEHCVSLSK